MELDPQEQKDGMRWLYSAGAFAVVLSIFLFVSDHKLSTSTREKDLGNTLRELRTAQTSLTGRVTDERQIDLAAAGTKTEPASEK
jgi:hypothetical protein